MHVVRVVSDPNPGLAALAELVDPKHPEDLEELIALRNETDEVARSAAIEALATIAPHDRYAGSHAAIVMAPFLWPAPSRFSAGLFGVLYTASSFETAVAESAYHAALIARASIGAPAAWLPRVAVRLELDDAKHADLRARGPRIYDASDYTAAQALGAQLRKRGREGVRYRSVRAAAGDCFGTFRPAAVHTVYDDATTLALEWDGEDVRSYTVLKAYAL